MYGSDGCIEVSVSLSEDSLPPALRVALEESGMKPEDYMDEATENIRHIAALLRSCVDLYKDRKPALDYLGFSFVAGVAVTAGSPKPVTRVMAGGSDGLLFLMQDMLQSFLGGDR